MTVGLYHLHQILIIQPEPPEDDKRAAGQQRLKLHPERVGSLPLSLAPASGGRWGGA